MPHVTLYSRPGCHLCEEMKEVLRRVGRHESFSFEEIDISTDSVLEREYGTQIPVLQVDGQVLARYRVTEVQMRRGLRGVSD